MRLRKEKVEIRKYRTYSFPVFDFLSCSVRETVVRSRMMANPEYRANSIQSVHLSMNQCTPPISKKRKGEKRNENTKNAPISHSLHKHRLASLNSPPSRLLHSSINSEDVVPVYSDGVHAIPWSARGYSIAFVLFCGRSRDGDCKCRMGMGMSE